MGLLSHFLKGPHPKTTLLLTRAGPVKNPEHVLYSHPGLPLSEQGKQALRSLAGLARRYPVASVYAADSLAEAEAAELLAEALGVPFTLLPELRERTWGEWEGLSFAEVREHYPEAVAAWLQDEAGFAPPGGGKRAGGLGAGQEGNRGAAGPAPGPGPSPGGELHPQPGGPFPGPAPSPGGGPKAGAGLRPAFRGGVLRGGGGGEGLEPGPLSRSGGSKLGA